MNTRLIIGTLIVLLGISILFDLNLFRFIIPLVLIWLGVQIITGKDNNNEYQRTEAQEDKMKRVLVFSNINQSIVSEQFKGGEIIAVFGGGVVDLTQAKTKEKEFKIELVAVFGSLSVTVPENWIVKSEGVGVLGTFDNKANGGHVKKTVEVELRGVAILGEVKVSN